jgi:hypothetical protein
VLADVAAISELVECIERLWGNLAASFRADLRARLDLLRTAADQGATDCRPVRATLQEVLLGIGTGALGTLSQPTRQRLAALTGIEVPGRLPLTPQQAPSIEVGTEAGQPGPARRATKKQATQ